MVKLIYLPLSLFCDRGKSVKRCVYKTDIIMCSASYEPIDSCLMTTKLEQIVAITDYSFEVSRPLFYIIVINNAISVCVMCQYVPKYITRIESRIPIYKNTLSISSQIPSLLQRISPAFLIAYNGT